MRKLKLFLFISTIFISQYFFIGSVFAIKFPSFGKKKATTTTTTSAPATTTATTTQQPSKWQRFKAKLPGGKPVQPTTTTPTTAGQPVGQQQAITGVAPTTATQQPSTWQRFKSKLPGGKPVQPTQPTIGTQRTQVTPVPAPTVTPAAVAPPPPPPPAAAPVPTATVTESAPAPEATATTTKWWQRKPSTTQRPATGVQIGAQRTSQAAQVPSSTPTTTPADERAVVVREETETAVVPASAAPSIPQESRLERFARGAEAAQRTTSAVVGTAAQLAGTGAQVASMFKKQPTQQDVYPQGQFPDQQQQQLPQTGVTGALDRAQRGIGAAQQITTAVGEAGRMVDDTITEPPAIPQPIAKEARVSQPTLEPELKVKETEVKKVTEEVPERTPEKLIAEFKSLTKEIIDFKPVPGINNVETIAMFANKTGEALRQLNKHLADTEKQQLLIDIIEIFTGIEKMGTWAKDFGLSEDDYIKLAKEKATKAQADYVQAFEAEEETQPVVLEKPQEKKVKKDKASKLPEEMKQEASAAAVSE